MNAQAKASAALNFAAACRPFIVAGIPASSLIPLAPPDAFIVGNGLRPESLGKVPSRFLSKEQGWCGLKKEGGSYVQDGVSEPDVAKFAPWPTGNVGILGRDYPGIDSDANTPAAARLVERAIVEVFGRDHGLAVRIRGNSPRCLYATRATDFGAVRIRDVEYRLPGEPEDVTHKLEIIGNGMQWVAAGVHPDSDSYGWASGAELVDVDALPSVTEADFDRLFEVFVRELTAAGGSIVAKGDGGTGDGELQSYSCCEAAMPVDAILRCLKDIPNTRTNFRTHNSFVAVLSAIRAALGREANDPETVDAIAAWATAHEDDTGADQDYFDRTWRSLDRGVRVSQSTLDRRYFRPNGILEGLRADFGDDADAINAEIRLRIGEAKAEELRLLREVARRLIFSPVDTSAGEPFPQVRSRCKITPQEKGRDWWFGKSLLSDETELAQLHEIFGKDELGFWRFFRALNRECPDCIFRALVKNPLFDTGEMIECTDKQGNRYYELNVLALPEVQKLGDSLPRNSCTPAHNSDVKKILEFVRMIFDENSIFELDTIAFMAQKKKRVGNGLILYGDPGTGKSTYCDMLTKLFNSPGEANYIPGNILKEDNRGFIMTALEGARILEIREIPSAWSVSAKAGFESLYKQVIDSSPAGDTVKIEAKGKDARAVPNHARLLATTNNLDAITISAQDRRIFYVSSGITLENMPSKAWWAELHAILGSPKRMAQFWRYLLDRDVEHFNHHQKPPTTRAKLAQQILTIDKPVSRHMRVVVIALLAAGRELVDSTEVKDLLHAAACNEARSSKRRIDDRDAYAGSGPHVSVIKEAFQFLQTRYPVLRAMRTAEGRLPTVYGLPGNLTSGLANANNREVLNALADDRQRHRLAEEHWPLGFEGPLRPDAKGTGRFRVTACHRTASGRVGTASARAKMAARHKSHITCLWHLPLRDCGSGGEMNCVQGIWFGLG